MKIWWVRDRGILVYSIYWFRVFGWKGAKGSSPGKLMWCSRSGVFSQAFGLPGRRLFARNSSSKLFVGGLSYDTNETTLKEAFGEHGEIIEVKVICDRVSGKSRGYGFIKFSSESEATAALEKMDDQMLDGRNIRVHYANKG